MKNSFKGKVATAIILLATLVLAGVAIFTAIRLYQLRQTSVAPNVPSSQPKAAGDCSTTTCPEGEGCRMLAGSPVCVVMGPPIRDCGLSFSITISSSTPTPTATATGTPTPTETAAATPTLTPTPTSPPGQLNGCNGTCGSNSNCQSGYMCYQGYCRTPSCVNDQTCTCGGTVPTPTSTPTATAQAQATARPIPVTGTDWPTTLGIGIGILTIVGSLILAL